MKVGVPLPRPLIGALFLCLSMFLIAAIDAAVKYLSVRLPPPQLLWGLYLFILLTALAANQLFRLRADPFAEPRLIRQNFLRSSLHFGSVSMLFFALSALPLSVVTAIIFISPGFITVFSALFLKEEVPARYWIAVAIAFGATLLIVQPYGHVEIWYLIAPILSAMCSAGFMTMTRVVAQSDREINILIHLGLAGLVWSTPFALIVWHPTTSVDWLTFAVGGGLAVIAHWLIALAFARAPASHLSPYLYSRLLWAVVFGYLVFGEGLSLSTLIGASIIIAVGVYLAYAKD